MPTVAHLGTEPDAGHYVAVARTERNSSKWWLYDDGERRCARPTEVACTGLYRNWAKMQSYIVFYERV